MLTLQEVLQSIDDACLKRDIMHEKTPANSAIMRQKCQGKFEAVLTGKDSQKCLIPALGSMMYLYRGQEKEYKPVEPSIYRPLKDENGSKREVTEIDIFIDRLRFVEFMFLLESHPVIKQFFHKHDFIVDYEGLAQHYGLRTSVLDLSSSIDVAMFFATCKYDKTNDSYSYWDDGQQHEAILYMFDPLFDNEPCPTYNDDYLKSNIHPIGLQAFPRPGRQEGYSLHLERGHQLKCYIFRFTFTCEDSKYYYDKCIGDMGIWDVDDILIEKAKQIKEKKRFSYKVFQKAYDLYKPRGFSKSKLKSLLMSIVCTKKQEQSITLFSEKENTEIIKRWNDEIGPLMANTIVRKPSFEYEKIVDNKIIGKRNHRDYMTLKRYGIFQMMRVLCNPECPKGAEWINYTNKPTEKKRKANINRGWQEIPANFIDLFGKVYLTPSDYLIL